MSGLSQDYGLVEETDLSATNRRLPTKRRLLTDEEKIYGIQRLWTSTNSKFVLVKKSEYAEPNNNPSTTKAFPDKFNLRALTRQKSVDRDSREGQSTLLLLLLLRVHWTFVCLEVLSDHSAKSRLTLNGNLATTRVVGLASPSPPSHLRPSSKRIFSKNKSQ